MKKRTLLRTAAVAVACLGTLLTAPTSAMALTTHSATDTTTNSAGQLVATARKWKVMAAFQTTPANLEAFAYCEQGVTVKVRSKMSDPIPTDGSGSATAQCHTGETLLGGGYT